MASNDLAMSHLTVMTTSSSKVSDSTVSHFTEAKSEMKEMDEEEERAITPRQTYFMCYATDLLGSFEQIKKRGLSGARAVEDVSIPLPFFPSFLRVLGHTCSSSVKFHGKAAPKPQYRLLSPKECSLGC